MSRLLTPVVSADTYRALAFQIGGLALGIVGFTVLIAGWAVTLSVCYTPLVVPLLLGLRWSVGLLARGQSVLARRLLGVETNPPLHATGPTFWRRVLNIVVDRAFWRQQAHLVLSWPIALVPLCLISFALQLLTAPIWYRWADGDVFWRDAVDTFGETLPFAAAGLALLVVGVHVLGLVTSLSRRLVVRLLGDAPAPLRTPAETRARRVRALTVLAVATRLLAVAAIAVVATCILVWALTAAGYFWPIWPLLSLALVVGSAGWVVLTLERPEVRRIGGGNTALTIQVGVSVLLAAFLVAVWAVTGRGYFWPIWAALGLALLVGAHTFVNYGRRQHRIKQLETSRAAAVDVQETELRRIERDLHDGAQARLVALGMSLGMAEEKLKTDPQAAVALLAEARADAREALEELRDLARGIHPPILADRGLEAAVTALAARSPTPVTVSAEVGERPPAAVESAAYFVVAEALTNATKHAGARRVDVRIRRTARTLVTEVADDGSGRADAAGSGLTGLRQRVAALDGSLHVESPDGGGTIVRAELPCE
jgi:signal transduction histidine kinase